MAHSAREISPSGIYHIVAGSNDKLLMFYNDEDYEKLVSILIRYGNAGNYILHAYCLMSNHFHILIETNDKPSRIMKKILNSYIYYYNMKYLNVTPLMRDRFRSETISGRGEFLSAVRYIYNSPERAGLGLATEYQWSSVGKQGFAPYDGGDDGMKHIDLPDFRKLNDQEVEYYIEEFQEQLSSESYTEEEINMFIFGRLNEFGASIRQLARISGQNRGKIERIISKYKKYGAVLK